MKKVFGLMKGVEERDGSFLVHTFESEKEAQKILNRFKYTRPLDHYWIDEFLAPKDKVFKSYSSDMVYVGVRPNGEKVTLSADNINDLIDDVSIRWSSVSYDELFSE